MGVTILTQVGLGYKRAGMTILLFMSLAHRKLQNIHVAEIARHAPSSVVNRVVGGLCYGLSNEMVALPSSLEVRYDI